MVSESGNLALQPLHLALLAVVLADELGQSGEQFGVAPPIIYKEGDEADDDNQDDCRQCRGEDERYVDIHGGEGTKKAVY